jgi:choline dehydrogenase-like flavoprotein
LRCETSAGERLVGAPIVALAAGVISTSLLALSRLGQTDKPIRLLSNPTMGAAFVMPRFIGRDLAERTSSLGQLIYRLQLGADEVVGVLYGADALPLDLFAARMPLSRPVSLRVARALAPALIMATCYLPGRYSANTLTAMRTASGLRRRIEASQTPQATAALKAAMQALARNLRPLGALMVPSSATLAPPGADAHQAGTFPMGTATSKFGELVGADGVYLVDGSCLPRLPAIHPTLTIMANAGRIGGEIARRALAS